MNRKRGRAGLETLTRPDVTPLVDLTFLLLIVFMITAPALEFSIDTTPPELDAQKIDEDTHKLINVDQNGKIWWEEVSLSKVSLSSVVSKIAKHNRHLKIYLRADESRPYGEVIEIMRIVKNAGIIDVSLVTEAEEN